MEYRLSPSQIYSKRSHNHTLSANNQHPEPLTRHSWKNLQPHTQWLWWWWWWWWRLWRWWRWWRWWRSGGWKPSRWQKQWEQRQRLWQWHHTHVLILHVNRNDYSNVHTDVTCKYVSKRRQIFTCTHICKIRDTGKIKNLRKAHQAGHGRLGVELLHNTDRSPEKSRGKMPSGQTFLQAEKKLCSKSRDFLRKCSTLRLLEERPRVTKVEISLGNVAFGDFWRRDVETEIFPGKCGTLRDSGEDFTPQWYVNSITSFLESSGGEILTEKVLRTNVSKMSSHIQLKIALELILT